MEMIVVLGIVVIVAGWYYFGKDTRKHAVDEAVKKSVAAVDGAAKKSIATVDETAKRSFATVDSVAKKSVSEANKLTANVVQTSRGLLSRLKIGRAADVSEFRQWASGGAFENRAATFNSGGAAAEFKSWVESLSVDEIKALDALVNDFCADQHFSFGWLGDAELEQGDPDLKQALEEAVMLFSLACWKANRVQKDVEALAVYENWLEDPYKGKNLTISQALFARMVDERKVKASPELLLAPEKERREFVVNTVKDFASRERKAFNAMLKGVLAEAGATAEKPLVEEAVAAQPAVVEGVEEQVAAHKRVSRRSA